MAVLRTQFGSIERGYIRGRVSQRDGSPRKPRIRGVQRFRYVERPVRIERSVRRKPRDWNRRRNVQSGVRRERRPPAFIRQPGFVRYELQKHRFRPFERFQIDPSVVSEYPLEHRPRFSLFASLPHRQPFGENGWVWRHGESSIAPLVTSHHVPTSVIEFGTILAAYWVQIHDDTAVSLIESASHLRDCTNVTPVTVQASSHLQRTLRPTHIGVGA